MGTLTGLQDHVRLARVYANEGIYDTSVIFFDGAIAQINKHLSTLDDPLIRAKWMNCKKALSDEIETVKQLDADRRALKEALGTRRPASPPILTSPKEGKQEIKEQGKKEAFEIQACLTKNQFMSKKRLEKA